jgi:hypothetical protein
VELYPEHLPAEYAAARRPTQARTPYQDFVPYLESEGVRLVDAHRLFLDCKAGAPCPLFNAGGTHWNHYGAFLALTAVLEAAQPALRVPARAPAIQGVDWGPARGADRDLVNLLNLWRVDGEDRPVPFPRLDSAASGAGPRLRVTLVGDSFAFQLVDALFASGLTAKADLLFYFRRRFEYPPGTPPDVDHGRARNHPIDPAAVDWQDWLLDRDLVILESNEIFLPTVGWSFVEEALKHLASERERRQAAPSPAP